MCSTCTQGCSDRYILLIFFTRVAFNMFYIFARCVSLLRNKSPFETPQRISGLMHTWWKSGLRAKYCEVENVTGEVGHTMHLHPSVGTQVRVFGPGFCTHSIQQPFFKKSGIFSFTHWHALFCQCLVYTVSFINQ